MQEVLVEGVDSALEGLLVQTVVQGAREVEQEMMQEVPLPLAGEGVELRAMECKMARGRTRREEGVLAQEALDSAQETRDMT